LISVADSQRCRDLARSQMNWPPLSPLPAEARFIDGDDERREGVMVQ
jgi:hypothetical protein